MMGNLFFKKLDTTILVKYSQKIEPFFIIHPSYLVLFLWIWLLLLSFLKGAFEIPEMYFSTKKNFLNIYFVKFGWGWTLFVTGFYMCLTAYVYGVLYWKKYVFFAGIRLLVGTCLWYFWTAIVFNFVHNLTGICIETQHPNFNVTSKIECIQLNKQNVWSGFDISGHCFLLIYCILLINSELLIQRKWNVIQHAATNNFTLGSKALNVFKNRYQNTLYLINVFFILNCILLTIWFFMLSVSCLYYHTFYSKALGGTCAIFSWMVTYNEWYKSVLSPGLPGCGPLQGMLLQKKLNSE